MLWIQRRRIGIPIILCVFEIAVATVSRRQGVCVSVVGKAVNCRAGGFDYDDSDDNEDNCESEYDDELEEDAKPQYDAPLPPSIRSDHKRRKKSTLQSIAEKSVRLTTRTALATAKQSGKAAYYLVKPKHVEREELFGLWRLDQQILPSGATAIPLESTANIEITPRSVVVIRDDTVLKTPYKFIPAQWPRAAKVEFAARAFLGNEQQLFLYKGQVDRKLAARHLIKMKGKIYRIEKTGWRGKNFKHVPTGTFVARKRLKLEEDALDENEANEYESDWGSESEDSEDVTRTLDGNDDDDDDDDSFNNIEEDSG